MSSYLEDRLSQLGEFLLILAFVGVWALFDWISEKFHGKNMIERAQRLDTDE